MDVDQPDAGDHYATVVRRMVPSQVRIADARMASNGSNVATLGRVANRISG